MSSIASNQTIVDSFYDKPRVVAAVRPSPTRQRLADFIIAETDGAGTSMASRTSAVGVSGPTGAGVGSFLTANETGTILDVAAKKTENSVYCAQSVCMYGHRYDTYKQHMHTVGRSVHTYIHTKVSRRRARFCDLETMRHLYEDTRVGTTFCHF